MADKEYETELPELGKFMDEFTRVLKNAQKYGMKEAPWSANILLAIDSGYDIPGITVELAKAMIEGGCQFRSTQVAAVQSFAIPSDPKMADVMWNQSFAFIEKCSIAERSSNGRIEDEPLAFCIDLSECVNSITTKDMHARLKTLLDIKGRFIYIFRVPYLEEKTLQKVRAVLSDLFPLRVVDVKPLNDKQLTAYLRHRLEASGAEVADDADSVLGKLIAYEKEDGRFDGLQTMNKVADSIIYTKLARMKNEKAVVINKKELAEIYSEIRSDGTDPKVVLDKVGSMPADADGKKIGF